MLSRLARKMDSTLIAQSRSGNKLGYFSGSARASAAFSLMVRRSAFHNSKTLRGCKCDGHGHGHGDGEDDDGDGDGDGDGHGDGWMVMGRMVMVMQNGEVGG